VVAVQLALVLVYLASMGYRTLAARTIVTAFEIGQNVLAIAIFILGQAVMAPTSSQRLLVSVTCDIGARQLCSPVSARSKGSGPELNGVRDFRWRLANRRDVVCSECRR